MKEKGGVEERREEEGASKDEKEFARELSRKQGCTHDLGEFRCPWDRKFQNIAFSLLRFVSGRSPLLSLSRT
jgi:hypothetical protein